MNNLTLKCEPFTDAELFSFVRIAGLSGGSEQLTPQLREFALLVMERCAIVGDSFADGNNKGNAGTQIRALFGV